MKRFGILLSILFCFSVSADTITLHWLNPDGSIYQNSTCESGDDLILPSTPPTKYGHTFAGWTTLTFLEYIESTINPTEGYIDTGLEYNYTYIYEIEYSKSAWQNIFMGARQNIDYALKGNFSLTWNVTTCMYSSTSSISTPSNLGDTDFGGRHTVKYQQSTATLLFDGIDKWEPNWITGDTYIPYNVYLFAFNAGGTPGGSRTGYARIYSYSVKNADGILIQNFVPARAGNKIGMYDTVSRQFFTNQGTGDFIAGPELQ